MRGTIGGAGGRVQRLPAPHHTHATGGRATHGCPRFYLRRLRHSDRAEAARPPRQTALLLARMRLRISAAVAASRRQSGSEAPAKARPGGASVPGMPADVRAQSARQCGPLFGCVSQGGTTSAMDRVLRHAHRHHHVRDLRRDDGRARYRTSWQTQAVLLEYVPTEGHSVPSQQTNIETDTTSASPLGTSRAHRSARRVRARRVALSVVRMRHAEATARADGRRGARARPHRPARARRQPHVGERAVRVPTMQRQQGRPVVVGLTLVLPPGRSIATDSGAGGPVPVSRRFRQQMNCADLGVS